MNIKFKDRSSIQSRATIKPSAHVPFSSSSSSQAHLSELSPFNIYQERPFKTDSSNLSFKGLFFSPVMNKEKTAQRIFNSVTILAETEKYLGSSTKNLYNHILDSKLPIKNKLMEVTNEGVKFQKKSILHLIYDGVVYPVLTLPKEIVNGAVSALKKVKPLQKWADKAYENPTLKKWRSQSKIESQINALRGMFETVDKLKTAGKSEEEIASELLQYSAKMFDEKTGNYDTKHERSLCRVVSGMVPAFFLANDAYNLSSACDNDPNAAAKEKKTRFRQEISRVGLNAYITLITLGALQKYINNSKAGIMLNTALTVLFTESFARMSNGKQITRLTPEQAKAFNAKNNKDSKENNYNSVAFKADDKKAEAVSSKVTQFKGEAKANQGDKKQPLLSFSTLLKASAVVIATGFGIKGLRAIKVNGKKPIAEIFDKLTKPFNNLYKKITVNPDYTIEKAKLDKIVELLGDDFKGLATEYKTASVTANKVKAFQDLKSSLNTEERKQFEEAFKKFAKSAEDNKEGLFSEKFIDSIKSKDSGLSDFAAKYNEIYSGIEKQGVIHLGAKAKKSKIAVDFVLAPFKFIYSTVKLPFTLSEKLVGMFVKEKKAAPDLSKKNIDALTKSLNKIVSQFQLDKGKEVDSAKFKSYIEDSINKSFNVDNMSNISNSELANLAKTSATAATIWFLMTDNYNMVMLKSNGEDKSGAELKFKERFVQEGSRLFYQTLLIDLFNSTFRSQYNNSLWGMTWITASNTFISEILNRKSVGMPVKAHSRDELIQIEKKKEESTGFARGYYDFMARLTGKKSLAEQRQAREAKNSETVKNALETKA